MRFGLKRQVIVLGLMSAIGPFAIDMYLPAFPAISRDLGGGHAAQLSLMSFLVAVSAGQLIYGPASDMIGRRPPLFFGLALFAISAVGCSLATSAEALTLLRFVQGIGACATMVLTRAVVRDLHQGAAATRLMSMLMLVLSVSPIVAPTVGGLIVEASGWRAIFWLIGALGAMGLGLVAFGLPETHPPAKRIKAEWGAVAGHYRSLLRDRRFLAIVAMGGFSQSTFFAYLAAGAFLLIQRYGLTPAQYSLSFGVCAGSFIAAAQFNGYLVRRLGAVRVLRGSIRSLTVFAILLAGVAVLRQDNLWVVCGLMIGVCASQGVIIPTAAVLALDSHPHIAGTASALLGSLQLIICSAVVALVSAFPAGEAMPMAVVIALCAGTAFALSVRTFGLRGALRPAPVCTSVRP